MSRVALGADHAGLPLCDTVRALLKQKGHDLVDYSPDPGVKVDYPDYAKKVAEAVQERKADVGILICGSGIGMAISANKHAGVRAVCANDIYSAKMSRLHNDCNVLCFGARIIGPGVAEMIVETFLQTAFEGGRHAARVAMLDAPLLKGQ
ncbi:MAG: ribose 5-phosphate isomerase B [Deltaproteobacteria bacterium]|nr:ribose 5-phosphate isomerase B [Deltaproteobacteria bacterium]